MPSNAPPKTHASTIKLIAFTLMVNYEQTEFNSPGPQKLYNAPIQAVPSVTVVPQLCDPVVDAESRSSLQPAGDRISSIARCLEVDPPSLQPHCTEARRGAPDTELALSEGKDSRPPESTQGSCQVDLRNAFQTLSFRNNFHSVAMAVFFS